MLTGVVVDFLDNAGLVLRHVTLTSAGTYSVKVMGLDASGNAQTLLSDVVVKVLDSISGWFSQRSDSTSLSLNFKLWTLILLLFL